MLSSLYIENLAVIEKTLITLDKGMNVFTGETGAGKSILIDALGAVLGKRLTHDIVRTGTNKAVISAEFDDVPAAVNAMLSDAGYPTDDTLVITREVAPDGKGSCRVNTRPATVSFLRDIGGFLVNIHGQHDTGLLLSNDKHIELLDGFGGTGTLAKEFAEVYHTLAGQHKALAELEATQSDKQARLERLEYVVEEIEKAELSVGEETELEEMAKTIRNSAKIMASLGEANSAISGCDDAEGAADLFRTAAGALGQAAGYFADAQELSVRADGLMAEIAELSSDIEIVLGDLDFNGAQQELIESRLSLIFKLKQKYGGSIEEILAYGEKARAELDDIVLFDERQTVILTQIKQTETQLKEVGEKLSKLRREASVDFTRLLASELDFLDMKGVRLEFRFTFADNSPRGFETAELLVSANVGEDLRPLSKIASGGELSRVMLALKNVFADKDEIPTLVFDEIDTGVSGGASQKIGLKLRQAAKNRQVLCVTHSAQVAALACSQYKIEKLSDGERTFTVVNKLDFDSRIQEIARIMSTGTITDLLLDNAHQMLLGGRED